MKLEDMQIYRNLAAKRPASILKRINFDDMIVLFILLNRGLTLKRYLYRRGLKDSVKKLKTFGLVEAVKLTDSLYYKLGLTERGKETALLFKDALKQGSKEQN